MQKLFGILSLLLVFGSTASATTKLISYSNYFKTVEQTDETTVTIYAGGTSTACTSVSTDSPCDSCAALASTTIDGFSANATIKGLTCNNTQIHSTLLFSVAVQSSEASMYTNCSQPLIASVSGSGGTTVFPFTVSALPNAGTAGQTVAGTVPWSTICSKAIGDSSCKKSFNATFQVGFDKDCAQSALGEAGAKIQIKYRYVGNSPAQSFGCTGMGTYEGFCFFSMYPGDEKAFVHDVNANTGASFATGNQEAETAPPAAATGSDTSGMKIGYMRIYYAEGTTFTSITPASPHADLATDGTTALKDKRVTGLSNGTPYVFLSASVDQAGNVEYFSDPSRVGNNPAMSSSETPLGETQAVTPEPVYGLLDNKNCFIATAAYGTGDATDVQTLREFRNRYLLGWEGGRAFVRAYYQISPPIANFISEREWLKDLVRHSLKPVVVLASIAFQFGILGIAIVMSVLLAVFVSGIALLRRGTRA